MPLAPRGKMGDRKPAASVPACARTSSNTTTPNGPAALVTSARKRSKRRNTMPAPSKRPGLNSLTPEAMRPERGRTAQPQREPRSSARIARGGSTATRAAGGDCVGSAIATANMAPPGFARRECRPRATNRSAPCAGCCDGRAGEFLLDGKDALAERLDQDRDLGHREHAAFARDVMRFLFAANERDDLAG